MASATLEQVGAWYFLQSYCHEQENSGTIPDCKTWPDRMWHRIIGVSSAAILLADSPLWHWRGMSLIVKHYNRDEQEKHSRMVLQRKAAIRARWDRRKPKNNGSHE